jgi:hypothetical protein
MGYITRTKDEDSIKLNKKRLDDIHKDVFDNLTKIKNKWEDYDQELLEETSYLISAVFRYVRRVNNG